MVGLGFAGLIDVQLPLLLVGLCKLPMKRVKIFIAIITALAMLALQALYQLQQFRPSVRLSFCLSVTRRYYVKTTARSTVQFALLDSKMCLVL